jgi:hypothetical protein
MRAQESLRLPHLLELSHSSLPYPGRLMRLLCPTILILIRTVDRLGDEVTMRHTVTAQFVGHDLSGLTPVG